MQSRCPTCARIVVTLRTARTSESVIEIRFVAERCGRYEGYGPPHSYLENSQRDHICVALASQPVPCGGLRAQTGARRTGSTGGRRSLLRSHVCRGRVSAALVRPAPTHGWLEGVRLAAVRHARAATPPMTRPHRMRARPRTPVLTLGDVHTRTHVRTRRARPSAPAAFRANARARARARAPDAVPSAYTASSTGCHCKTRNVSAAQARAP